MGQKWMQTEGQYKNRKGMNMSSPNEEQKQFWMEAKKKLKNRNIPLTFSFQMPKELLDNNIILTELHFSNIVYDEEWHMSSGTLNVMAVDLNDYKENIERK